MIGYLFIDTPEANAAKAAEFVEAGHTELKLKVGRDLGQDYDTIAAIRDRVGSDVKIRIDANMNWSVPAAIKWIRALEPLDLQFVEQPVPDFDLRGLAEVRRAVSTPIAADEACTSLRSALELIKADAVRRLRRLSIRGRRPHPCEPDRGARGGGAGSGARSGAGPSSASRRRRTRTSSRPRRTSRSRATPTIHCSWMTSSPVRCRSRTASIAVSHDPGLGVTLDPERVAHLAGLELRESPFYDEIKGDAPSVGQIF